MRRYIARLLVLMLPVLAAIPAADLPGTLRAIRAADGKTLWETTNALSAGAVSLDTPVEALRTVFDADKVAVVLERGAVIGIVSKIDVIDFLTRDGANRRPA